MLALAIRQPYAELILSEIKTVEEARACWMQAEHRSRSTATGGTEHLVRT